MHGLLYLNPELRSKYIWIYYVIFHFNNLIGEEFQLFFVLNINFKVVCFSIKVNMFNMLTIIFIECYIGFIK